MSELPRGAVAVAGRAYMPDAKGSLIPLELVKPQDMLQDQTVRDLFDLARVLAGQISDFKGRAFEEVDTFQAVLAERYKAKVGGEKGNITLATIDGLQRVQVQVSDVIQFGPELQEAKSLIDECLNEWAAEAAAELRAVVMNAFNVDREGQVNRAALLGLLRLDIKDERWLRAMEAIRDSIRVVGSSRYVRFYFRAKVADPWSTLSLNVATAPVREGAAEQAP